MNPRTLKVLEYDKILERVAAHCSFSGGAELAYALLPSDDLATVQEWLAQTTEAYKLLDQKTDIGFGGVRDVRPELERAERGAMLLAQELLEVRNTLLRARMLQNTLTRLAHSFPRLAEMAANIEPCSHVIAEIGRCINDRGEVVDGASDALARIRQELRVAQERLLSTLDRLIHSSEIRPYLQDALVTQRQGRYVIPVRAEHKGNVDGIVHDQSASGATLFIEPIKVVQQNNAVRELELQEEREVRRILTELTELVADEATYIRRDIQILAELDFTLAKAKYAYTLEASTPEMVPFRPGKQPLPGTGENGVDPLYHPGSVIDLRRARHPLLDPNTVVPVDIYLDESTYIIVITGPNTGGKTVTLKTVGLLALMAQSGLMLPVEPGSRLSVFEGVYADIGDEQSIEQNLSTFSSHMTHIIEILEEADPTSLVLLDELGAGTDPDEGSALAMALLDNLRDRGITTFATTHYSDLKLYAHNTPGARNASVEFDVETLSPTYELSIGLPGRSNALIIARRLGLNPVIVERAEGIVRPDALQADALLDDIKRAKQEALQASSRAKERERQVQAIEADLRYQLAQIEEARRSVIAETRALMQQELDEVRREIEQTRRQLARATQFSGAGQAGSQERDLAEAERAVTRRQRETEEVDTAVVMPGAAHERLAGPIEVGDRVWVPNLQASGEVLALYERTADADVQIGNFRLKLPLKRLELRQKAVRDEPPRVHIQAGAMHESPGIEFDMRGARVEEGLAQLERYLDNAYLARLPWVRIIHGKGTGALRDAVRNLLRQHPAVGEFRAGSDGEGGDGVTIAKLVGN
ncbi:MAG TPA: endonuclease MutS2 [Caldilineaceae bacterium]|nr:endonuclease MutS2 [Caldilineaceae bacterium]